jgi:hypothetical protein
MAVREPGAVDLLVFDLLIISFPRWFDGWDIL